MLYLLFDRKIHKIYPFLKFREILYAIYYTIMFTKSHNVLSKKYTVCESDAIHPTV